MLTSHQKSTGALRHLQNSCHLFRGRPRMVSQIVVFLCSWRVCTFAANPFLGLLAARVRGSNRQNGWQHCMMLNLYMFVRMRMMCIYIYIFITHIQKASKTIKDRVVVGCWAAGVHVCCLLLAFLLAVSCWCWLFAACCCGLMFFGLWCVLLFSFFCNLLSAVCCLLCCCYFVCRLLFVVCCGCVHHRVGYEVGGAMLGCCWMQVGCSLLGLPVVGLSGCL